MEGGGRGKAGGRNRRRVGRRNCRQNIKYMKKIKKRKEVRSSLFTFCRPVFDITQYRLCPLIRFAASPQQNRT